MKTTLLLFTAQPPAGLFNYSVTRVWHSLCSCYWLLIFQMENAFPDCSLDEFWAFSAFCPNLALSTSLFSSLSAVISFLWTHSINPGASCPSCIWDVYRLLPYTNQSLPPYTDFHLFPSPSLMGHVERSLAPFYRRGNQGSAKGSEWPSLHSWWACTAGTSTLISRC